MVVQEKEYIALIATLTAVFTKLRPKTKRKR